jgi:hypothetical protein
MHYLSKTKMSIKKIINKQQQQQKKQSKSKENKQNGDEPRCSQRVRIVASGKTPFLVLT